jgi:GNAT superfamily N-acetyltransferase
MHAGQILIRDYISEDRERVTNLIRKGLRGTQPNNLGKLEKQLNQLETVRFNRKMWVALYDTIIIGCISIFPTQRQLISSKEMVTLERLSVDVRYRRKGIATLLLKTVENECKHHGIKRIRLCTQTNLLEAINFYEKCGYNITSNKTKVITKANKGLIGYEKIL